MKFGKERYNIMGKEIYWLSPVPSRCETCGTPITNEFIDGKVVINDQNQCVCAIHCNTCFTLGPGIGRLGTGLGQRYRKQPNGKWKKVGG